MITPDKGSMKVLRYEDYLKQQRSEAESQLSEADRAAADYATASQRYQDTLRAFPPDYYERIAHGQPKHAVTASATAAAAAAVQAETVDDLLDHNYDGIQEYDNPTPGWWYLIFGGSIAFGVLYIFVYHFSTLVPSMPERHAAAEAKALEARFAELNTLPLGEEKVVAIMSNADWLTRGETIFVQSCALCHQADGRGSIGPNLTDEYYKNVETLMTMSDFIAEGSPNGAMPPQKTLLNDNEIALVTAYVASLRGKNLPTGDGVLPDYLGHEIAPWPVVAEGQSFGPTSDASSPATNASYSD